MIIQCRPSASPPKWTVVWITHDKEFSVDVRAWVKVPIQHSKEFNTFADANGFCSGMMKRGIFVKPILRT